MLFSRGEDFLRGNLPQLRQLAIEDQLRAAQQRFFLGEDFGTEGLENLLPGNTKCAEVLRERPHGGKGVGDPDPWSDFAGWGCERGKAREEVGY